MVGMLGGAFRPSPHYTSPAPQHEKVTFGVTYTQNSKVIWMRQFWSCLNIGSGAQEVTVPPHYQKLTETSQRTSPTNTDHSGYPRTAKRKRRGQDSNFLSISRCDDISGVDVSYPARPKAYDI